MKKDELKYKNFFIKFYLREETGYTKEHYSYYINDNRNNQGFISVILGTNNLEEAITHAKNMIDNTEFSTPYNIPKDWNLSLIEERKVLIIVVKKSKIEGGRTIVFLSEKDHYNNGVESYAGYGGKEIIINSTGESVLCVGYNDSEPYNHYIFLENPIDLKEGEILIKIQNQ